MIPDADLMGDQRPVLHALNNSIRIPFQGLPGEALKITIHDVDITADESIDILVSNATRCVADECDNRLLSASSSSSSSGSAFIKMAGDYF